MQELSGISASEGIAIGPILIYRPKLLVPVCIQVDDPGRELDRFKKAQEAALSELDCLLEKVEKFVDRETTEIFQAQRMMLCDPDMLGSVENKILHEKVNADFAFYCIAKEYELSLESLTDEYLRARAADVRDITFRLLRILQNRPQNAAKLTRPTIILAEDLTPSDTMQFDKEFILGFYTEKGGTTSHSAILSRALGVPAVVAGNPIPELACEDEVCILDGTLGKLFINCDEPTVAVYKKLLQAEQIKKEEEKQLAIQDAVTLDGVKIEVVSNIGNLGDARTAIANGAEGIGLLRTEFSYIENENIPSEEDLVKSYSEIFDIFGNYPIVIRTLDIGGDKEMSHLNLPAESNPFLGCRGIRLCLKRPDLFKPQLRAILRAGVNKNLRIMFPMVSVKDEIIKGKKILKECMDELDKENLPYNCFLTFKLHPF